MKLGILGLTNSGKSTLYNSLTKSIAGAHNYPFSTVETNIGIVDVPDERLNKLAAIYNSKKITPAVIEFMDIAGLVKGAGKGEGLGNAFLAQIRESDAIVHVVRMFIDPNVTHVDGSVDPIRDIETVNYELIFSDLEVLQRRITKTSKAARTDKAAQRELGILEAINDKLENGVSAREIKYEREEDLSFAENLGLLTQKPVLYAVNVSEDDLAPDTTNASAIGAVLDTAAAEGAEAFIVCAKTEEELLALDEDERLSYYNDLGVTESGLSKLIAASYKKLGLISFLTAGPKETRAWTIKNGTKAPQAAGKIHSDIERGFIRAEIVNCEDLIRLGSYTTAKDSGLVRLEGKEYVIKESDVVLFRFNV